MSKKPRKSAETLVATQPGAFERWLKIILALCQGHAFSYDHDPARYGQNIIVAANTILEGIYNGGGGPRE